MASLTYPSLVWLTVSLPQAPARLRVEDPEAERFLQYFYDHCVLSLVQPLVDLPERTDSDSPLVLSESSVALLTHICDLLCFFVAHHTFRSKYLILSYPAIAKSIARLLRPRPRLTRHTHLRLAALRFLRACVARNDDFYNRFLIKYDLIRPVLDTAEEERDKDNLLGSACLEFFEFLRTVRTYLWRTRQVDSSPFPRAVKRQGPPQSPPGPRRRHRPQPRQDKRPLAPSADVRVAYRAVGDEQRSSTSAACERIDFRWPGCCVVWRDFKVRS